MYLAIKISQRYIPEQIWNKIFDPIQPLNQEASLSNKM
jgi:hypothetical protein